MADQERQDDNEFTMMRPHSSPEGNATPANARTDAENVGEGAGSFLGGVGGMALGATAGPVGIVIGAIAGALGGWWAGHGVANALTSQDHDAFRAHYESSPDRAADRAYEQVTPAYAAGHLAARNPDYTGRSFDQIEADLQRAWNDDVSRQYGQWPAVRGYARAAFDRARGGRAPSE